MTIRAPLALCLSLFALGELRATEAMPQSKTFSRGEKVCNSLSLAALVGKSPLLVIGVGGAHEYLTAPDEKKNQLGLFAHPAVWGTLLVLVALVGFKDSILTVFSQLKAPLNALAQGLHAVGAVVGFAYLGANVFGGNAPNATASLEPLFAAEPTWLDHLGNGFLWILMALIHSAVWIVFNLVEVAVLLNPIPFVDTALKAARTALIGLIALATQIHPILGFVLVLPIIAICFASVPFALRFAILGTVFTWDTVRRWFGHKPYPGGAIRAFTSMGMPGVRLAVCGTVERGRTGLEFVYRRFFLLWKVRVPLPMEQLAVSKGLLAPRLVLVGGEGKGAIWLRFAPRYQKSEADLAGWLGLGDVMPYRFGSTIGSAWRDLKQIWSRRGKGGKA